MAELDDITVVVGGNGLRGVAEPAWMCCYQHPHVDEPWCAIHCCTLNPGPDTLSCLLGWNKPIGDPPKSAAEQAAYLIGGTSAVMLIRYSWET